jgi:hypothetical protein
VIIHLLSLEVIGSGVKGILTLQIRQSVEHQPGSGTVPEPSQIRRIVLYPLPTLHIHIGLSGGYPQIEDFRPENIRQPYYIKPQLY